MTPFEKLRDFVERDRMQSSYTKEQIIELIDLIYLDLEKVEIIKSYSEGWLQCNIYELPEKSRERFKDANDYYNKKYNK